MAGARALILKEIQWVNLTKERLLLTLAAFQMSLPNRCPNSVVNREDKQAFRRSTSRVNTNCMALISQSSKMFLVLGIGRPDVRPIPKAS
jgi:hypothetical protein